jgi:pectate lyase
MKSNRWYLIFLFPGMLVHFACVSQKTSSHAVETRPIAFPGAEGFGKYTTGGRGGKVLIVTNLEDSGEGSLRQALRSKDPKIIVFAVSGTIHLETPLSISANTTIAGQSAPGDGICIADHPVTLGGNNIIVRYMRFRMGDKNQNAGMVDGSGHDDAFGGNKRSSIIVDHCSMSWSNDEVCSVYSGDSTTLQWNIISEPLNYSYHFEQGDKDYEHHGYGGIMGGRHMSIHHNLFAHCQSRTPRFDGVRNIRPDMELADFRNNVIYNWGGNNVYGGEGGQYNIVNNYYRPGPNTNKTVQTRIANPFNSDDIPFGKWFIDGNFTEASQPVSNNNWSGVVMDKGTDADAEVARMNVPFVIVATFTQPATEAYQSVLTDAGANYRRDTLDQRIIRNVKERSGGTIDVQGGFPHGTPYAATVNAWPFLKSAPLPEDSDKDGMPDSWEKKNGLNPGDPSDASQLNAHTSYTNIEMYLNELVNPKK